MGGIAAFVFRVTPTVGLEVAPLGAADLHFVAFFDKLPIRVGQFGPPEAYRPAGDGRYRRVGRDEEDLLGFLRVEDVDTCAHRLMSFW